MAPSAKTLIILGILFVIGLLTELIGRRIRLPRVTLLLIFGFAVGPSCLGIISPSEGGWFSLVADMALVMVGFLLGEKFTVSTLRRTGKLVIIVSITEVIVTAIVVFVGLVLMGTRLEVALLLAAIATATAPAATTDVIHECKTGGLYSCVLMEIVAVDDAWGLIVFSVVLAIVHSLSGDAGGSMIHLSRGAWDIGGAVLLGILLGIPMSFITGRIQPGEPSLIEALGIVFLCGGIALWLHVSFLLSAMVLGTVVANFGRHCSRPFHAIEGIESPFMILFFLLAGAKLHIDALIMVGFLGICYIVLRIIGRIIGGWLGGRLSSAEPIFTRWIGFALMPQAGVALGMMLVAVEKRPELTDILIPIVVASTVIFEIIGPVLTRQAVLRWAKTEQSGPF